MMRLKIPYWRDHTPARPVKTYQYMYGEDDNSQKKFRSRKLQE